jgi:polar amino acid transport system substrate-binding protein
MRLRTTVRPAALLAGTALLLTACGGDATDTGTGSPTGPTTESATEAGTFDTITDGVLTVCSDIPYAPFEFEEEGTATGYSGFDIELMEAIAASLDLELAVSVTGFDAIQSGTALAAEACDVAASAMTITEEREENVDFADPYFDAEQSLMAKAELSLTGLAEIEGALGVQADTTGQAYAVDNFDGTIIEFPGAAELFAALEAGTIVAVLQDLPVNVERARQDDSLTIVETYDTQEQYGFAVAEGNTALRDAINQALAGLRQDGTYDTLYSKYFEA